MDAIADRQSDMLDIDQISIRHFDLEEYHRLIELGLFSEDERVELIDGILHRMSPRGPRHGGVLKRLLQAFIDTLRGQVVFSVQDPITIPFSNSEPEPDLALVRPREGGYFDRHPLPEEIFLVVEIAESSLAEDEGVKLRTYAAAGIEEYWIINLVDVRIEVYRDPVVLQRNRAIYHQCRFYFTGDRITPRRFPDCEIDVAMLLP